MKDQAHENAMTAKVDTGNDTAQVRQLAARVRDLRDRTITEVGRIVVGMEPVTHQFLIALLAGGHVLLEGVPGIAKTTLSKTFARILGIEYHRLQFTPDLLPSDVTGTYIFDRKSNDFVLRKGPLFCNVLLVDEINRAPAKTQAALLEAMQERQVTVDGVAHVLRPPFTVLATQNPIEYEGTYPLPEAQLDRFLLRLGVGYPTREQEWEVLERRLAHRSDEVTLEPRAGAEDLLAMRQAIERVHVDPSVGRYIVDVVTATRESTRVQVGASPRGSLAVLKLTRSRAALQRRDFVVPEDVKAVAVPALAHRLTLRPELWVQRVSGEEVVQECLDSVPTPRAD